MRRTEAIGATVTKVSEAEVTVAGGIDDILIVHPVADPSKVARLAVLWCRASVKATVDHYPDHLLRQASRLASW